MQKETSQQKYVRLMNLRTESGERLYQRLCLARDLLADREWTDDPTQGGGDIGKALDRLEEEAFADVCGAISLTEMLSILQKVPDVKTWKANKFNLRRMWGELMERQKRVDRKEKKEVPEMDSRDKKIAKLMQELEESRQQIHSLRAENRRLRKIVHQFLNTAQTAGELAEVG